MGTLGLFISKVCYHKHMKSGFTTCSQIRDELFVMALVFVQKFPNTFYALVLLLMGQEVMY